MNILITSAGQRVSLVRSFQAEAKKLVPGGKVFTTDMLPHLSAACYVSDGSFSVPPLSHPDYIEKLLALAVEKKIILIVPTIDTELLLLSQNRERFLSAGIQLIVSDVSFIQVYRDKRRTNIFFQQHGIGIPKEFEANNLQYPLFVKPFNGSLSVDTHVVREPSDMQPRFTGTDRYLLMEYISPDEFDEYTVDCYYDKSGVLRCAVPRKRMKVRAGEINKGKTCKNYLEELVFEKLHNLPGLRGCITMQFFLSKEGKQVRAIEINPRFGGGFPLSYQAGGNFPGWLIAEYMLEKEVPTCRSWQPDILMLRYDGEVFIHGDQVEA